MPCRDGAAPKPHPEDRITAREPGPVAEEPSTAAAAPPAATGGIPKAIALLGLIVAVLALPVVLLLGGPVGGWVLGVVLWLVNWWVAMATSRRAMASSPTVAVGLSGISFVARAWTVALVLFVVALRYDEAAALAAAGVFIAAFTADLIARGIIFSSMPHAAAAADASAPAGPPAAAATPAPEPEPAAAPEVRG